MAGQDGVLGFPLRSDNFGGQVAGFRPGFAGGSAEASKDSTCVAKATTAEQVAPRLPPSPKGLWRTGAAGCFTLILSLFMFSALNYYSGAETAERLFPPERILPPDKDRLVVFDARCIPELAALPGIMIASGKTAAFLQSKIIFGGKRDHFMMPDLSVAGSDIKESDNQQANLISSLKGIFRNEGVPNNLVWLAEVESALNPEAESKAGATGLFQLMPATAQRFGLKIFPVDDRKAPDKSAKAAAAYLRFLRNEFGCWALALAAYNAGEGRVGRAMKNNYARTFREVAPYLPSETRKYVPRVMAIMALREDQSRGVPSAACLAKEPPSRMP